MIKNKINLKESTSTRRVSQVFPNKVKNHGKILEKYHLEDSCVRNILLLIKKSSALIS